MIETEEYYGGTYPEQPETEEKESAEDFDSEMADIIYEERELGLRE